MDNVATPGELLRADAQAGAQTFERAYLDCRLTVYRYLRTRSGSEDAATELTAVTFEQAFRSFHRYDRRRPIVPWLLRIARNVAVDASRRSRPVVNLEAIPPNAEPATTTTPEDEALAAEQVAELRAAVAALPDSQRDAIALRYAAGLTAREIGTVIGKSEEATQKLLTRALGSLREAHDARG